MERYLNARAFLHRGIPEKRQNKIYGMLLKEISFLHFNSALRYHQLRELLSSMSRLTPLSTNEVIRKLRKLGFIGPIPGGRHQRMVHMTMKKIIPIPMHSGNDISVGLIREIIREIEISREEWIAL